MKRTLVAGLLLASLTACGGGDGGSDNPIQDAADNAPQCSDVWAVGKTLPKDYEGCMRDGTIEAAVVYNCDDGSKLTGYDNKFFALVGGPIEPQTDETYSAAFDKCKPS